MENKIEKLEDEGLVVKAVKYLDGSVEAYEMVEDMEGVVAVEVVTLEAYEANGYEADGLAGEWVEVA